MDMLSGLITTMCEGFMIFGGIIPYIPQYLDIVERKSLGGFSPYVCLTLLIANILRIQFWFYKHFETPLLLQSLFMIMTMVILMHACVEYMPHRNNIQSIFNCKLDCFWKWTDFGSYLLFLSIFTGVTGGVVYTSMDHPEFMEAVGLLAALTESVLGLPQVLKNTRQKSTAGVSLTMVILWAIGDTGKALYCMVRQTPFQFLLCALIQITMDCIIFIQYLVWGNKPSSEKLHIDGD